MRRTDRLFEILQLFRGGRLLLAREIAEELEVSVRTVYRDIDTLVASGIPIEGERGVGYMLREPIFLPPLALTHEERQALALGVEIVRQAADGELASAAEKLLAKLESVSPTLGREDNPLRDMSVYAGEVIHQPEFLADIRRAIAQRRVLRIAYRDEQERQSERRIHPLQAEYWGRVWTCPAWCEARNDFRVFRIDRIESIEITGDVFPLERGRRYRDYLAQLNLDQWQVESNEATPDDR